MSVYKLVGPICCRKQEARSRMIFIFFPFFLKLNGVVFLPVVEGIFYHSWHSLNILHHCTVKESVEASLKCPGDMHEPRPTSTSDAR